MESSPRVEEWKALSIEYGYEGAAAIIRNSKDELLFLLSKGKDGALQAEIPGGKPERLDEGDAMQTAIREIEGAEKPKPKDFGAEVAMETTGGTTGKPSLQYITEPKDDALDLATKLESKYIRAVWSKIYNPSAGKFYVLVDGESIPIRKFNTYFIVQNMERMKYFVTGYGWTE